MARRFVNRLNNLSPREWIRFQKSWFIHNPPRREPGVLVHPGKFPETLAQEFVEFFSKPGQVVLDPMAGTGSTLVGAIRSGRQAIGVELNPEFARLAENWVRAEETRLRADGGGPPTAEGRAPNGDGEPPGTEARPQREDRGAYMRQLRLRDALATEPQGAPQTSQEPARLDAKPLPETRVIVADAREISQLGLPPIDYCLTSPPYWDMLRQPGFETQRQRRQNGLPTTYSDDARDLANIVDYQRFVDELCDIYVKLYEALRPGSYLTIVVKNVKKGNRMYPLAWDLGRRLGEVYVLKDERVWLQDNIRLAPYGMFNAWVSNTHHHYCLNFRRE